MTFSRRMFVQGSGAGSAMMFWGRRARASAAATTPLQLSVPLQNRAPLFPQPYMLLPLGSIRPSGWLRRQLEIQAKGLCGRLDEVWPDVGSDSGWVGGPAKSIWENVPYWLDGLVPLAWLLNSDVLKAKALKFIEWGLSNQFPSGMIGPAANNALFGTSYGKPWFDPWWPPMVMLKVFTQYHELTSDPRVIALMSRYFEFQLDALKQYPLVEWGRFRWQDELLSVIWLFNRTGNPQLLELANLLSKQGWNWRVLFDNFPFKHKRTLAEEATSTRDVHLSCHGVDVAMGLKATALWSLISGNETERLAIKEHLATLDRYHGLPTGLFSADEMLAGPSPSQGTETCTLVEMLFSLEHALAISGEATLADRIERIAYNALPGALTEDMWARQYDQQPNQIQCSTDLGPWTNNGPAANLFGLVTQDRCCTCNHGQGWPKLAASLWMATREAGLAAMIYAPCEVSTEIRGVPIRLSELTDYPFRGDVRIRIEPEGPVRFPMKLRRPSWAQEAVVKLNGKPISGHIENGFIVVERTWRSQDTIDVSFALETRAVPGFHQSMSIERGPLLFSLPLGQNWEKLRSYGLGAADWKVYPTSSWNYGIEEGTTFEVRNRPVSSVPFSRSEPPTSISVEARSVPQWTMSAGTNFAPTPPQSPIDISDGLVRKLTLIPYGAAKLRITSFPTVRDSRSLV